MASTLEKLKKVYESRIAALLNRWREACLSKNWLTSEIETSFEKLPTGSPVYSWWFDTDVTLDRKAHVRVILESETEIESEPAQNAGGGLATVTVVHCFASISLGAKGSDHVKWEVPDVSELLDDDEAFQQKFRALEEVNGTSLVSAIEQHVSQ